jgi:hypothetical protein
MQGSLPAVHPQARFAATPIDGAMAWLTVHWPMPDFCSFCTKAIFPRRPRTGAMPPSSVVLRSEMVLLGPTMLLDLQFSTADIKRLVSTNALAMLGLPKPGNRSSNG